MPQQVAGFTEWNVLDERAEALANSQIGGTASSDGPFVSFKPNDNNSDFNPFKNSGKEHNENFRIPTEAEYKERCHKPATCYSSCQEADKLNREKCDLLRKRVACALKDAGCPSIVKPMTKLVKKKGGTCSTCV